MDIDNLFLALMPSPLMLKICRSTLIKYLTYCNKALLIFHYLLTEGMRALTLKLPDILRYWTSEKPSSAPV